jgi:hypothetical protein
MQVRLFRHKVTVDQRPDLGQALRSPSSLGLGRTSEHFVSLGLVSAASARHAFLFALKPRGSSGSGSSSSSSGGEQGGLAVRIQSWTTRVAAAPLASLLLPSAAANSGEGGLEAANSGEGGSEAANSGEGEAAWAQLVAALAPVVKVTFGLADISVDGPDIIREEVQLEVDEWRAVAAALNASAAAIQGGLSPLPATAGPGRVPLRVGWLKLPADFDGAAL